MHRGDGGGSGGTHRLWQLFGGNGAEVATGVGVVSNLEDAHGECSARALGLAAVVVVIIVAILVVEVVAEKHFEGLATRLSLWLEALLLQLAKESVVVFSF